MLIYERLASSCKSVIKSDLFNSKFFVDLNIFKSYGGPTDSFIFFVTYEIYFLVFCTKFVAIFLNLSTVFVFNFRAHAALLT